MIRLFLLALAAFIALPAPASAGPLFIPLLASALSAATAGAVSGAVATGIATIAIGAATVSASRGLLILERPL